jgi:hypothetical protein
VVVGELYPALPDVFVEVRHEALEVFLGAVDAYGKDGGPTQLVDKDEDNVRFSSWFSDVLRETKAIGDTGAGDSGGGFQEVSALHMYFLQWMKFVAADSESGKGPEPVATHIGDN